MAVAVLLAVGCTTDTANEAPEQADVERLEEELEQAHSEADAREKELAEARQQLEELQTVRENEGVEARTALREAERELRAAQDEAAELRLRYDDEVRADLQAAYDAEIERACEEAAAAPARPVSSFVEFEQEWEHLEVSEDDLIGQVADCAGPRREESQLSQQQAATELASVVDMVMDVIRTGDAADDFADQMMEEAGAVADGALFEDSDADWVEALNRIADGYSCTTRFCSYISILEDLQLIGAPGTPRYMMGGGSRTVGDGEDEARPGTWITYQVDGCYWERLDDRGEIIDNNFVTSAPQVQATIRGSDHAFNSEGCGRWMQF